MRRLLLLYAMLCLTLSATAQFTATITPGGPTTFCQGGSVYLIANAGADAYQWYFNGIAISGANDDTLEAGNAGNYEVAIDSAGISDTSMPETVIVNTVPAQPGILSGPDTICDADFQHAYSVAAVPGATNYVWLGISAVQSGWFDTTILPTINGYVLQPMMGYPAAVSVKALNSCGISPESVKESLVVGPPQIDGHYPYERDVADMMSRVCPGHSYTLFPVLHGYMGYYADPFTYQWYLDNTAIPGATDREFVITRGGNYSVKIITEHCGTFNIPKKVYQDVPNSITISPPGPLSFCTGNVTPLIVSFDLTGVSDPIKWDWIRPGYNNYQNNNTYSVLPDTSGYYIVMSEWGYISPCRIYSNAVEVTMPPDLEVIQSNDTLFATPGYSSYQWLEGNVPISGATSQSHVLTYDGIYSVEAVYSNGCTESSDTLDPNFRLAQNGSGNAGPLEEINIYPNPSVGAFTVTAKVPEENQTASVTITDIAGHVLFTKHATVKDGMIEETIDFKDDIGRMCIIKVKAKGCNKTSSILKQ